MSERGIEDRQKEGRGRVLFSPTELPDSSSLPALVCFSTRYCKPQEKRGGWAGARD